MCEIGAFRWKFIERLSGLISIKNSGLIRFWMGEIWIEISEDFLIDCDCNISKNLYMCRFQYMNGV